LVKEQLARAIRSGYKDFTGEICFKDEKMGHKTMGRKKAACRFKKASFERLDFMAT